MGNRTPLARAFESEQQERRRLSSVTLGHDFEDVQTLTIGISNGDITFSYPRPDDAFCRLTTSQREWRQRPHNQPRNTWVR